MMTAVDTHQTAQTPEIAAVDALSPLRSVHTNSLAALLERLGSALMVTTLGAVAVARFRRRHLVNALAWFRPRR